MGSKSNISKKGCKHLEGPAEVSLICVELSHISGWNLGLRIQLYLQKNDTYAKDQMDQKLVGQARGLKFANPS